MKIFNIRSKSSILIISLITYYIISTSFKQARQEISIKTTILQSLKNKFNDLERSLNDFRNLAIKSSCSKKKDINNLRKQFLVCRIYYKRLEPLTAHIDPYLTFYLNAPNVPKIEYEKNLALEKKVEGFQVLEEIIFNDSGCEKNELINLINGLIQNTKKLKEFVLSYNLKDWFLFDAMRVSLIRLATQGITGFDSPIALASLSESAACMESMIEWISLYEYMLIDDKENFKKLVFLLNKAKEYLNSNNDFEKFDRFYFIQQFINPCYQHLTLLQNDLGIEFIDQSDIGITAYNPFSKGLFYPDFLKDNYFLRYKLTPKPTMEMVELGKVLFYDSILSDGRQRSCASCHQPNKAFTDGLEKSLALDKKSKLSRNTPTLINAVYQHNFQLDGRASHLEEQFHMVIFNTNEMNKSEIELIKEINKDPQYKLMFKKVFQLKDNEIIDLALVKAALVAYIRSLTAFNSVFDKQIRGELPADNKLVNGFNLFMGKAKCATCHFPPVFNGSVPPYFNETEAEVIGVPEDFYAKEKKIDPDEGKFIIASAEPHRFAFKTPTLRNISLTSPYMHNGNFKNLKDVMDFYNKGGGVGLGLNLNNQTLPSENLNLTDKEIDDIIYFMNSLTDTTGLTKGPNLKIFESISFR
jgi:cytochrome c peroxidase